MRDGGWTTQIAQKNQRKSVKSADKKRFFALWVSRAESAQEIDDNAYHQNQAKPAAADDRTAKVKPAATEQ
jgi:hypothetical protein